MTSTHVVKNRTSLIRILLSSTGLTTPLLEQYFQEPLRVSRTVVGDTRHYSLSLPGGECVEAGMVRALAPEGRALLQADEPLGPWAEKNGFALTKKFLRPLHIPCGAHPIARRMRAPCKKIIGRGYFFLLKKKDALIPLSVEEYWNTALF